MAMYSPHRKDVLLTVARELEYPDYLINHALDSFEFKDAGSLVDYLYVQDLSLDDEERAELQEEELMRLSMELEKIKMKVEEVEEEEKEEKAKAEAIGNSSSSTLRQETAILYNRSLCLVCGRKQRCFICLPCCHFTLCADCERRISRCPLSNCDEVITSTIKTFI